MAKRGKRFSEILKKVNPEELYSLPEAVSLLKTCATARFGESVELVLVLNLDRKKTDQSVRGVISLPHGTGKRVKVAAFVDSTAVEDAKKAGADFVGGEDLVERVSNGFTDFDYAISTPDMMPSLAKLGQVLGPKGLMPNPKVGTVTRDVAGAVSAFKGGAVKFRSDPGSNVHVMIGKVDFDNKSIEENARKVFEEVKKERPKEAASGGFVKRASICSTMGAGIRVDVSSFL